jgi:hypothetical protein
MTMAGNQPIVGADRFKHDGAMRYILLAAFAVVLALAMINWGSLGVPLQIALALVGSAFFAYYLWIGFRSGTMEAPGVGYLAGHRTENPVLFWFCAAFNAIMFAAMVAIAANLAGLWS